MCTVPELYDLDLKDVEVAAVDLETYDPDLKGGGSGAITNKGFVVGIAIATHKQTLYFPIRHLRKSQNRDPKQTWKILNKKLFQNPKIKKVFHNAMYDVCWIRAESGLMPKGALLDTMVAASLIDENRMKYSLDSLSKDYLKDKKYKYDLKEKSEVAPYFIKDPMSHMNDLPYEMVKEYAEQDVNLTLRLWKLFEKLIHQERTVVYQGKTTHKSLTNIFKLETALFPCLVEMRFKGVRVDTEKAKAVGKKLNKRATNLIKLIRARTGIKVDIWASASIKKLLDKLNIKDYKETPKSKMPQLSKDYLKNHENRFLRFIATARECDKAQNAFVKGLLKFVYKGRIHADINQIRSDTGGTVTGRFSMSNPNLQQIPAKGLIGRKMRELFLPEEGERWGSFDYSQQEPRLVLHYALKNKMFGAETLAEAYTKDPSTDFHKIVAKMANIDRKVAKTINLGLFYGMGKNKLSMQLNLNKEEARELFNNYHNKVPFVRDLSSGLQEFANTTQLIYTLEDRFCRFNKWEPINKRWNEEKRMFVITRYEKNEETGENEAKETPVPILTRREAEDAYLADRARSLQDPDPHAKYFTDSYQPAFTYKALNKLIQGSAADMTKKAMVLLFKEGIIPHIQIHDELCVSIKNEEQALKVKNIMENAVRLEVPNKVDYASGKNWGNIK